MSHDPIVPGDAAPDFDLPGTDGRRWQLADVAGPKGLVVVFMCNHCPYVLAIIERVVVEAAALRALGIGMVAINSNDASTYPADAFDPMVRFARQQGMDFPYLHDESQAVARAYGAVCTPDFFGFDGERKLCYRGRLDASGRRGGAVAGRRELYEAMQQVAETGSAPADQAASIGCSIKWKRAA